MSETTDTSVFVCAPEPTDPGCPNYEQSTPTTTTTTTTVGVPTPTTIVEEVIEVTPVATPIPMTELPVTGFNGIDLVLVLLAGVLIAIGTDLVGRSKRL